VGDGRARVVAVPPVARQPALQATDPTQEGRMQALAVRTPLAQRPLWVSAGLTHLAVRLAGLPAFLVITALNSKKPFWSWFSSVDASWYRQIALNGYPPDLVIDPATGQLLKPSAVAFYPAFPFSVRAVMAGTGLPFPVAGPLTGFLFGLAASIVVAYLIRTAAPAAVARRPALPVLAVAALNAFPTGAVLSFAYSEGLGLLLIATSLLLIARRQYAWALLPVVLLGFTRAVALPMVAVLIWHTFRRWRSGERPSGAEWVRIGLLGVVGLVSGFAWPLIAGNLEGNSSAFFLAQSYYRHGGDAAALFRGFSDRLSSYLPGPIAIAAIVVAVGAVLALSFTHRVRELGPELQAWGGCYLVYLIAVSDLDASGMRFLLLSITVPLLLATWWSRRTVVYLALGLMMVGQYLWVYGIWGGHFPGHLGA
jgi:hypothetical protein